MSLFNQFISSAVKQIGRDAGKIVSNKIFSNDRNISNFNENQIFNSINDVYCYSKQGLKEGDYINIGNNYFKATYWHLLLFIPAAFIPFIGFLLSIIFAYQTFIIKYYQILSPLIWVMVKVKDNRFSDGFRETKILKLDSSKQEILLLNIPNVNKIVSIIYLICSLIPILLILF